MISKKSIAILSLLGLVSSNNQTVMNETNIFKKFWETKEFIDKTPEQQAKYILGRMNLTHKANMLHGRGTNQPYTGHTWGIDELGIPEMHGNDGVNGFRSGEAQGTGPNDGTSTRYPSAQAISASWDESVIYKWGAAIGKEFYDKGAQVILGPGLNVHRIPQGGRNFEYLSGEDPYLGYVLSKPAVWGVQNQSIEAVAKHYVLNNQEYNRLYTSENADERTKHEMYYPPFEGAAEAGVAAFMCSYNKIDGEYSCDHNSTLNTDLRDHLGFEGYVMSDWGATKSLSMPQGMDQEMGGDGDNFPINEDNVATLDQKVLDESVYRILLSHLRVGTYQAAKKQTGDYNSNVTNSERKDIARQLAEEQIVLLSNKEKALPMNLNETKSILIIGNGDVDVGDLLSDPVTGGFGSSYVALDHVLSPVNELAMRMGVEPFDSDSGSKTQRHCNKETGKCVIYVGTDCNLPSCVPKEWDWDATLVFLGQYTKEGFDRNATNGQVDFLDSTKTMINEFSYLNNKMGKKTIVVVNAPGESLLPWSEDVDAQLHTFYAGERMAEAVFNIIEGKKNPSGKLPITMPHSYNEQKMTDEQYPGVNKNGTACEFTTEWVGDCTRTYTEKLLMGYRWYDFHKVEPLYPFGHGLSYTKFDYDAKSLEAKDREVQIEVSNSGDVEGKEVVQLYIGFPEYCLEPPQVLKGFKKISIGPGEKQKVTFTLRDRDLSIWNETIHGWTLCEGSFTINVGSSSRDIRATTKLVVSSDETFLGLDQPILIQ